MPHDKFMFINPDDVFFRPRIAGRFLLQVFKIIDDDTVFFLQFFLQLKTDPERNLIQPGDEQVRVFLKLKEFSDFLKS